VPDTARIYQRSCIQAQTSLGCFGSRGRIWHVLLKLWSISVCFTIAVSHTILNKKEKKTCWKYKSTIWECFKFLSRNQHSTCKTTNALYYLRHSFSIKNLRIWKQGLKIPCHGFYFFNYLLFYSRLYKIQVTDLCESFVWLGISTCFCSMTMQKKPHLPLA